MKRITAYSLRAVLYFFLVAPLLLFAVYAFSTRWFFPQPFPVEWTTITFLRAINDSRTLSSMMQGIWIAILVSVLSLLLALPAARVLGLRKFRGVNWHGCFYFCPLLSRRWLLVWDSIFYFCGSVWQGQSRVWCWRTLSQPCLTPSLPCPAPLPVLMKTTNFRHWLWEPVPGTSFSK